MNRERKYRAYNPKTGDIMYSHECPSLAMFFEALELAPDAVIDDWTGFRDSKNVDIYEGDIFDAEDVDGLFGYVEFYKHGWHINWGNKERDCFSMYHIDGFEIIGNIHQNPELLTP